MRTRVTEMMGIDFPIFAFTHCRDVVAAVTSAGGVGVLGAVAHSPEQLDVDLKWIKERTGGKPFGVDLLMPRKYAGAEQGGLDAGGLRAMLSEEHRQWIDELLERYGVPALPPQSPEEMAAERSGRTLAIDPKTMGPLIDVAFEHKIALMASALGSPPDWLVERSRRERIPVAALAGRLDHAIAHRDAGVDIVIAQGTEGGGHTGEIGTMVLVPQVVDAVAPIPVLAAGGIASGRQIAAALALGAEGVWCGSVWLTTHEAETVPAVKEKFLAATSADTRRSRSLTGKPARMLRSAWTDAWDEPGAPPPLPMPLQSMLVANAQRRIHRLAHQPDTGARQLVTYFVGQVVGQMNVAKPARSVVQEMVEEFLDSAERLGTILEKE
jgi:NAD(P)H-dependent flavin oxidoreductase YrpB (nitropropane dioxygenase family)